MNKDKKLQQEFQEYSSLAKENPGINVAALMVSALQNQNKNLVSPKQKHWAYLVSVGLPPLGFLFALKFYLFDDKDDAASVGNVCVALTIISVLVYYFLGKLLLSGSGTSLNQIQQIKPQDIMQLTQ